jgi:large subunit ribosomal protein L18
MAKITRKAARERLHTRIRRKVRGTQERPRMAVSFSGNHIYVQIIDDEAGRTLASVATTEKDLRAEKGVRANVATAARVGRLAAERAVASNIKQVVFDRGGFTFHGKVKALADAAREAGLEF